MKKNSNVIEISKAFELKNKRPILHIQLYKEKNHNYSYTIDVEGKKTIHDELVVYSLVKIIEDIVGYNEDPMDILDFTQVIKERLGYGD